MYYVTKHMKSLHKISYNSVMIVFNYIQNKEIKDVCHKKKSEQKKQTKKLTKTLPVETANIYQ